MLLGKTLSLAIPMAPPVSQVTTPAFWTAPPASVGVAVQPCSACVAMAVALSFSFISAGLESVDHYPILVAVTGILVRLLVDTDVQG